MRVRIRLRRVDQVSVKAMGWAYDQRGLRPVTKAVLVAIANIADEEGYCWPSMKRLAGMVEISTRSAIRHVQDLERGGYLIVERERERESGAQTSNGYRMPLAARQLPLLPVERIGATPYDKLSQGGDRATQGPPDKPTHGGGDNCVTPIEPSLERSLEPSTKTKAPKAPAFVVPDWVPAEQWESFKAMRRSIRAPLTDDAAVLTVRELDRLRAQGHEPAAVLEQSVMRSWRGVFPIKGESRGGMSATQRAAMKAEILRDHGVDQ